VTACFLAPLAVHDSEDLQRGYFTLLIIGGVLVFALLLFAKWGDRGVLVTGVGYDQETNPLSIANLGGFVASCAMFLRTRRFAILGWIFRLVIVAAALALIVKSGSRGQLVAAVATLILVLPIAFKASHIRGLVPILIAFAVIGYAAQYATHSYIRRDDGRWSERAAGQAASFRWSMSEKLLSHWADSPGAVLLGLGNSAALDPNVVGSYPHTVPIEVLCEEGLGGFAIYTAIGWLALRGIIRALRQTKGDEQARRLLAVACAGFVFTFMTTLKEGNLIGSAEYFMAAILLARMPELLAARSSPQERIVTDAPLAPRFANMMR
jgi:hypothetical protein